MAGDGGIVTYADFKGGEFGVVGAWAAPADSFTGRNVLRYADGSLGPRLGEKPYTLTGMPTGEIRAMGVVPSGTTTYVWFVVGTALYRFNAATTTSQAVQVAGGVALGAVSATPMASVLTGPNVVLAVPGNALYRWEIATNTLFTMAGGPAAVALCVWGDRMYASVGNRLYYSQAADHSIWPAANYIDLEYSGTITSLTVLRNQLVITKSDPLEHAWWVLTGVPSVSGSLRKMSKEIGPEGWAGVVETAARVGFAASGQYQPGEFNGIGVALRKELRAGDLTHPGGSTFPFATAPLRQPDDWMIAADRAADSARTMLVRRDGAWTRHTRAAGDAWLASAKNKDWIIWAANGGAGVAAGFYIWQAYNDRPPLSTDALATAADPANVWFWLPEYLAPKGAEVQAATVIVEFRRWNTNGPNNTFDVRAWPVRLAEGRTSTVATLGSFSEPPWSAADIVGDSSVQRRSYSGLLDYASGVQVGITNMRGVAIQRIVLVLNTRPRQGS